MPILLIKTSDGKVYQGQYPIHAIMVIELGIDPDKIIDVGFISKGRKIWCNRQPD